MKNVTSIVTAMAFVLAFGSAFADEIVPNNNIGTEVYDNAFKADHVVKGSRDFGAKPGLTEDTIEVGAVLYESAFAKDDSMLGETEARGSAAGGMADIDENTRIWEELLSPSIKDLE